VFLWPKKSKQEKDLMHSFREKWKPELRAAQSVFRSRANLERSEAREDTDWKDPWHCGAMTEVLERARCNCI
jgi:hypothetical protein